MTNPNSSPSEITDTAVDSADPNDALPTPAVVLVGLPGSDTSDVAHCVGHNLGLDVRDAEEHMADLAQKPASDVLIQDGEAKYRELELAASTWACSHAGVAVIGAGILDRDEFWGEHRFPLVVGLDIEVKAALKNLGLGVAASPVINPRATWMRQADERRLKLHRHCNHVMDVTGGESEEIAAEVTALASK